MKKSTNPWHILGPDGKYSHRTGRVLTQQGFHVYVLREKEKLLGHPARVMGGDWILEPTPIPPRWSYFNPTDPDVEVNPHPRTWTVFPEWWTRAPLTRD